MTPPLHNDAITGQDGDVAFAISSGNLALDFVGTLGERRDARIEHLREPADVAAWLVEAGVLDSPPPTDDDTLLEAVALREACSSSSSTCSTVRARSPGPSSTW